MATYFIWAYKSHMSFNKQPENNRYDSGPHADMHIERQNIRKTRIQSSRSPVVVLRTKLQSDWSMLHTRPTYTHTNQSAHNCSAHKSRLHR